MQLCNLILYVDWSALFLCIAHFAQVTSLLTGISSIYCELFVHATGMHHTALTVLEPYVVNVTRVNLKLYWCSVQRCWPVFCSVILIMEIHCSSCIVCQSNEVQTSACETVVGERNEPHLGRGLPWSSMLKHGIDFSDFLNCWSLRSGMACMSPSLHLQNAEAHVTVEWNSVQREKGFNGSAYLLCTCSCVVAQ